MSSSLGKVLAGMSLIVRKGYNLLEYLHPRHLSALFRGVPAAERKAIRRTLRPQPATWAQKRDMLLEHGRRYDCQVLIETGTFRGDTLAAMIGHFQTLHSIELADQLYADACKRFADHPEVKLHHGDSGSVLPTLLNTLDQPCLFWLDGHASGGVTARGEELTPILRELQTIMAHPVKKHAILIDDAREFGRGKGYPSLAMVEKLTRPVYPVFTVVNDVICILPEAPSSKSA
jgi:hypothetical protein